MRLEMVLALLVVMLLLSRSLVRRDRSAASPLNLEDLLLGDDGRMSKASTVMFGSFVLTSWVIVYLTVTNRLDGVIFSAYIAAWVAPTVTALIKRKATPDDPPQQ